MLLKLLLILQASITLTWDPVASNINNECIVVSYYKIYRKRRHEEWPVKHYATRRDPPFKTTLKTEYEFAVTAVLKANGEELESKRSESVFINIKEQ